MYVNQKLKSLSTGCEWGNIEWKQLFRIFHICLPSDMITAMGDNELGPIVLHNIYYKYATSLWYISPYTIQFLNGITHAIGAWTVFTMHCFSWLPARSYCHTAIPNTERDVKWIAVQSPMYWTVTHLGEMWLMWRLRIATNREYVARTWSKQYTEAKRQREKETIMRDSNNIHRSRLIKSQE